MLPDYLKPNLEIVFVGLNPGEYSYRVGHYFARRTNLFWEALYAAQLVPERLGPEDDWRLPEFGYGLTDLVKRPTANIDHVTAAEFVRGARALRNKVEPLGPRVVCFVGLTGYRLGFNRQAQLGEQGTRWHKSRLFIVPSTSRRNAYYRQSIVEWFRRLKTELTRD